MDSTQLDASPGEIFSLIRSELNSGWWLVENDLRGKGLIPANRFRYETSEDAIVIDLSAENLVDEQNDEYFSNYGSNLKIHYEMVSDVARNDAYHRSIEMMGRLLYDRIVLDVGAGTGLLSLFCAKAGAKHVISIEASDMSETAEKIVRHNECQDRITIVNCTVKDADITFPIDVIVSEWMGTMLFFESMIEPVLFARDNWLEKDSGLILPRFASLWICLIDATNLYHDRAGFWSNVNGIDLSEMSAPAKEFYFHRPVIDVSYSANMYKIVSDPAMVYECDLMRITMSDVDDIAWSGVMQQRVTTIDSNDGSGDDRRATVVHGVVCWFEVCFSSDSRHECGLNDIDWPSNINKKKKKKKKSTKTPTTPASSDDDDDDCARSSSNQVFLSTSSYMPETHWKQALLILDDPIQLHKSDSIDISFGMKRNVQFPRHYKVSLGASVVGSQRTDNRVSKNFNLWR